MWGPKASTSLGLCLHACLFGWMHYLRCCLLLPESFWGVRVSSKARLATFWPGRSLRSSCRSRPKRPAFGSWGKDPLEEPSVNVADFL